MERSAEGGLPRVLPSLSVPRFVGRAVELHRLTDALARPSAMVFVEGEAGIGKSRLVQEALGEPGVAARRPLAALCPPFREALTLGPVVDAARDARPDVGQLTLTPPAGVLRPLFPQWGQDLPTAPEVLQTSALPGTGSSAPDHARDAGRDQERRAARITPASPNPFEMGGTPGWQTVSIGHPGTPGRPMQCRDVETVS
ncbi:AAA family ATPase [Streptomyces hokutonensis]|uniref:AAA family ATPase n=1 Tax=Streptomyces hokutonensis TaxID=1306990 RepID=UPI0033C3B74C